MWLQSCTCIVASLSVPDALQICVQLTTMELMQQLHAQPPTFVRSYLLESLATLEQEVIKSAVFSHVFVLVTSCTAHVLSA